MQSVFRKSVAVALALVVNAVLAAPVTSESAAIAARRWLADDASLGCALGSEVAGVRTCSPQEDVTIHVVELTGGGFVVMSSDTTREPVVAFSSGGELEESDNNPLWVLLKKDTALRAAGTSSTANSGTKSRRLLAASADDSVSSENEAKWQKLLGSRRLLGASQDVSPFSDVRVAPLVQSKWNQGVVRGGNCYNYNTPTNYLCGCVATAGAQIMRYFQWPSATTSIAPFTNNHCKMDDDETPLTTKGGRYKWSEMPLEPIISITENERMMIGKLTSDIGICAGMSYSSDGSSVGGYMLAEVFTNHFGYANALALQYEYDISNSDDMKNAILSNLDAGLPVLIGIFVKGSNIGHSIVGDGYGYSDDSLYLHFNMGWGGLDDAWYAPPNMGGTQFNFNVLNGLVCNIFTNQTDRGGVICSGRVLDNTGSPIANSEVVAKRNGTVVKSTFTDAKGIYSFVLAPGSYDLSAHGETIRVDLYANVGTTIYLDNEDYGYYNPKSKISIGNRSEQDITITGINGVSKPEFSPASCRFYPSTNIAITCATDGATIRYTLDGSDPTEDSDIYRGPIFIEDDTQIKARAWKSGLNPSAVVEENYTYDATQGGLKGDNFANPMIIRGQRGRRIIDDNSAYTVEDEPNEPLHTLDNGRYYYQYRTVWYKWIAPGSGTMTFEVDLAGWSGAVSIAAYTGDTLSTLKRLTYNYDLTEAASINIDVAQGYTYYVCAMTVGECTGTFTLRWLGDLTVATSTTDVPVGYDWLEKYFPGTHVGEYESIAERDSDDDNIPTWVEYVLGTDPTNIMSRFEAFITMKDGKPVVESNVDEDRLADFGYELVKKGKSSLDPEAEWDEADPSQHRFFRLSVEKK